MPARLRHLCMGQAISAVIFDPSHGLNFPPEDAISMLEQCIAAADAPLMVTVNNLCLHSSVFAAATPHNTPNSGASSSLRHSMLPYTRRVDKINARKKNKECAYDLSCPEPISSRSYYCEQHRIKQNADQQRRRYRKRGLMIEAAARASGSLSTGPQDITDTTLVEATQVLGITTALVPSPFEVKTRVSTITWKHLIWITSPDKLGVADSPSLGIQIWPEDHKTLAHDAWLKSAYEMEMENTIVSSEGGGCILHQGLVTMLAVMSLTSLIVSYWTWKEMKRRLDTNTLLGNCRDDAGNAVPSIFFIHWTTEEPENPSLETLYGMIRLLRYVHGAALRPFPNEHEAFQERSKLGDIRALDDIAASSPQEFSFRPKTCFGSGSCTLTGVACTVHKRSHSGCASHVKVKPKGEKGFLTCVAADTSTTLNTRSMVQKKGRTDKKSSAAPLGLDGTSSPFVHWFHQEYIQALQEFEFRVFIATQKDPIGLRGRRGRIVAVAKTSFNRETNALASRILLPEDHANRFDLPYLEAFSLHVFERLRARSDALLGFESLEVGVRLDIGVAQRAPNEHVAFVNEVTRWYGAHYFSNNILAEPKTQICKAFAQAFSSYVKDGMADTT
ncbi:hypothetical protein FB567DRAFT_633815 [Paraphoma chrysanthemicola]|uniref:Uncharacterized protein n=1 Tax=Paraphoma chrysanthemicola TaxID=798071 RepID=A0A8K0VT62_9PLEO|nr:hypothetical protein FB567DRAFT_633815 [Paraphoma chrysanthemicola]